MNSGNRRLYITRDKIVAHNVWVTPQFFSKEVSLPSAVAKSVEKFQVTLGEVEEYLDRLYANPQLVDDIELPEVLREQVEPKQPKLGNSKKKTSTK